MGEKEDTFSSSSNDKVLGGYKASRVFWGDLNGDGLVDVLLRDTGTRFLATGSPGEFLKVTGTVAACYDGLEVLDANGDGKIDVACIDQAAVGAFKTWVNDGTGAYAFRSNVLDWGGGNPGTCYTGGRKARRKFLVIRTTTRMTSH